jgi:hypothetical protein
MARKSLIREPLRMPFAKRSKKPATPGTIRSALGIRAVPAWHDWFYRFSDYVNADVTTIAAKAVEQYAARRGFEPPPKRLLTDRVFRRKGTAGRLIAK